MNLKSFVPLLGGDSLQMATVKKPTDQIISVERLSRLQKLWFNLHETVSVEEIEDLDVYVQNSIDHSMSYLVYSGKLIDDIAKELGVKWDNDTEEFVLMNSSAVNKPIISLDELNKLQELWFYLNESCMNISFEGPRIDPHTKQLNEDAGKLLDFLRPLRDKLADQIGATWVSEVGMFV